MLQWSLWQCVWSFPLLFQLRLWFISSRFGYSLYIFMFYCSVVIGNFIRLVCPVCLQWWWSHSSGFVMVLWLRGCCCVAFCECSRGQNQVLKARQEFSRHFHDPEFLELCLQWTIFRASHECVCCVYVLSSFDYWELYVFRFLNDRSDWMSDFIMRGRSIVLSQKWKIIIMQLHDLAQSLNCAMCCNLVCRPFRFHRTLISITFFTLSTNGRSIRRRSFKDAYGCPLFMGLLNYKIKYCFLWVFLRIHSQS